MTCTFDATPAVDVPGFVMIPFRDGTMLELYAPQAVPSYGYNDGIAIGFRAGDVETASLEIAEAGAELLGEITRMSDINYAYRHFRGPDGRVYDINESKPQPDPSQLAGTPTSSSGAHPASPRPHAIPKNGHIMTTYSSRADVITDRPGRYAKQLVSHLGRKLQFTQAGDTATAHVVGTVASITTGDGVLVLQVGGSDPGGVARAEGALASHLVRFGEKDELHVTWQRSTA